MLPCQPEGYKALASRGARGDRNDIKLAKGSYHAFNIEQPDAMCTKGAGELSLGQWRRYLIENGERGSAYLGGCSFQDAQGFHSASSGCSIKLGTRNMTAWLRMEVDNLAVSRRPVARLRC